MKTLELTFFPFFFLFGRLFLVISSEVLSGKLARGLPKLTLYV